jgi:tetratricopeptide (TPR) repeat protein
MFTVALKRFCILPALFFVWISVPAQIEKPALPDSLLALLQENKKGDRARIDALVAVAEYFFKENEFSYSDKHYTGIFPYINELGELSGELGYNYGIALSHYYKGRYCHSRSSFSSAVSHLTASRNLLLTLRDSPENKCLLTRIYATFSAVYLDCNLLPEGYETVQEGLKLNALVGSDALDFALKNNLAGIYSKTKRFKEASEIMIDLLRNSSLSESDKYLSYRNLAANFLDMQAPDSAILYVDSAFQYIQPSISPVSIMHLKGYAYMMQENYESAEQLYKEILNQEDIKPGLKSGILIDRAKVNYYLKSYDKALNFTQQAIDIARETQDYRIQEAGLKIKMTVLTALGRYRDAVACIDDFHLAIDSLEKIQNKDYLNQLVLQKEIKTIEEQAKIERLEQEYIHNKRQLYNYIIIGVLIFITIIVFLFLNRKRILLKQKKMELKNKEMELDLQNRKLTSFVLTQLEKDELLNDIINRLRELPANAQIPKQNVDTIIYDLKKTVNAHSRDDFELYFVQTYPVFFNKLLNDFPHLTRNELRLCAFLKLNLSSKDIASISNITLGSVKIARKRLRKSLNINDSNDSFTAFFSKYQ